MNTEEANKLCICRGVDDGRPMVHCANCDDWFHFKCIDLDEATAEELDTFFCQPCSTKTNQSTTYKWQLTDDELLMAPKPIEVRHLSRSRAKTRSSISVAPAPSSQTPTVPSAPPTFAVDSDSDVGMKDDDGEYTGERPLTRLRRGKQVKKAESDSDRSPSPDSKSRKRKAPAAPPVNTKRKRTLLAKSPSPLSDPVRKYCFGKLQEVIEPIFVEYKTLEDGTERSEEDAKSAASAFNRDLENAVFEHYSEPDKKGNRAALAKYKERFRMLTYNLGQSDRVLLRKGIANGHISAQELSEMSSADLANEQAKQEMEKAAQEALHQSILKTQTILPRAKMTHKGEEIIETNASEDMRVRDEEERERLKAGLRVRTGSILEANPESAGLSSATGLSGVTFENHLAGDGTVLSPEKVSPDTPLVLNNTAAPLSPIAYTKEPGSAVPDILSPTEITATPMRGNMHESRPSFDLNALWTGDAPTQSSSFLVPVSSPAGDDEEDVAMDLDDEAGPETDFGMFLDGVEEKKTQIDHTTRSTTPPPAREDKKLDSLPVVWSGDLVMPLDPKPALVNKVAVRQVGGRSFGISPSVWNLLFKGNQALIEGRVPTDRSIKYLVTTRLNPSKELIVVHFAPTEESKEKMAELFDFLLKKDRHGLIFPWGANPPPTAPGKDLYLLPIQASKPLPEFIDLLDHVLIPKQRDENMLLGVFVLSKGKIVVPPITTTPSSEQAAKQATPPTASSSQQSQQQTPMAPSNSMASLLSTLGTTSSMPYAVTATPPVAALLPGIQHPPQLPVGMPSNNIPGSYQFSHSSTPPGGPSGQAPVLPTSASIPTGNALLELASSIQNLSPDQLNLILQGLMAGGAGQSPTPPTPAPPLTGPSPWPPANAYAGQPQQTPPYQGSMGPGYDRYSNASRSPQVQSARPRDGPRDDHYGRERRLSHSDRGPGPRDSYRGRGGGPRGGRSGSDYSDGSWNRRRAAAPYTDQ